MSKSNTMSLITRDAVIELDVLIKTAIHSKKIKTIWLLSLNCTFSIHKLGRPNRGLYGVLLYKNRQES